MKEKQVIKCDSGSVCQRHQSGKYLRWKCGDVYSKEERHKIYLSNMITCSKCGGKSTKDICKNCYYKYNKHHLLGKKLPQKWVDNIAKGQGSGENHNKWKGGLASYSSKHKILIKMYGNPKKCESCGVNGKKNKGDRWNIQWANISGEYRRVIEDYKGLCAKCHSVFDRPKKDFKHGTVAKYKEKCRCDLCKEAKHLYRNNLIKYSQQVS